jgi:hypothetical protein
MIRYLIELIEQIEPEQRGIGWNRDYQTQKLLIDEFAKEIDRLDPRDFAPAVQCEFVMLRAQIKGSGSGYRVFTHSKPFRHLAKVLQFYGGPNSWVSSRNFSYVADGELRIIIERDYRELSLTVFSSGAWKSTVILARSILEALLYDALTCDAATAEKANAASAAPRYKGKVETGDWRLADLIEVACELEILPTERGKTIDQVLRDYRNFVHPKREIRAQHACSEAEALLAKGALEGVCNHFEKHHAADPVREIALLTAKS